MRKLLILTIFLMSFLLIGVVSAVEYNSSTQTVTVDENSEMNVKSVDDCEIVQNNQNYYHDAFYKEPEKINCKVKAKTIKAYVNQKKNFNIEVSKRDESKINKQIPLLLSIKIGKKYKNYSVRTNYQGIARFNVKKLPVGIHKVSISSKSKNYNIHAVSKIIIKDYPSIVIKTNKCKGYPHFRFVKKGAKKGDGYTLYAHYSLGGIESPPRGVYVFSSRMWDDGRLHVKVLKAKFYFRNNKNGKYITKWVTKPYQEYSPIYGYLVGSTARTPLIKGYTPAHAKVWYKIF